MYQFWNATLRRTGKINVYFSPIDSALTLIFELGGIRFCWLGLQLYPGGLNYWSALPCCVSHVPNLAKIPQNFWHVASLLLMLPIWYKHYPMDCGSYKD